MNMRNPSWRCPHCNQSVCYPEIRLDQNMAKILKDVGHNATDVIIEASGTWKVAKKTDEKEEPLRESIHDLEDPMSLLNAGPDVLDLTGDDGADMEIFGDNKVEDQKPCLPDAQGQSNNKDASNGDYSLIFDISDVIALDPVMLSALGNTAFQPHQALSTGMRQEYSNLFQIPVSRDPKSVPVPFSQTPSPRDRPVTTSTTFTIPNPSPQFSQVHASLVTPTGTYLGRTCNPTCNQTYQSQGPSAATLYQSRRVPFPGGSQLLSNVQSFVQFQHVPRVLIDQLNSNATRVPTSNHVSKKRQQPNGHTVQFVSRISDLMDVNMSTPDTTNWRPRMRGSLVPGALPSALDHMIIRPTQQPQTSTRLNSPPVQTPSVQTSQAQSPFSPSAYRTETVLGNRNHPVPAPPGFTRPS